MRDDHIEHALTVMKLLYMIYMRLCVIPCLYLTFIGKPMTGTHEASIPNPHEGTISDTNETTLTDIH